jgi:hypothetical protein
METWIQQQNELADSLRRQEVATAMVDKLTENKDRDIEAEFKHCKDLTCYPEGLLLESIVNAKMAKYFLSQVIEMGCIDTALNKEFRSNSFANMMRVNTIDSLEKYIYNTRSKTGIAALASGPTAKNRKMPFFWRHFIHPRVKKHIETQIDIIKTLVEKAEWLDWRYIQINILGEDPGRSY